MLRTTTQCCMPPRSTQSAATATKPQKPWAPHPLRETSTGRDYAARWCALTQTADHAGACMCGHMHACHSRPCCTQGAVSCGGHTPELPSQPASPSSPAVRPSPSPTARTSPSPGVLYVTDSAPLCVADGAPVAELRRACMNDPDDRLQSSSCTHWGGHGGACMHEMCMRARAAAVSACDMHVQPLVDAPGRGRWRSSPTERESGAWQHVQACSQHQGPLRACMGRCRAAARADATR
jgi:hypothetical protein